MRAQIIILFLLATSLCHSQQKQIQYLSGTDARHTVTWDFYCTAGRNSGQWTKIEVPSCWEQQGFGNYNYGRDNRTNGKNSRFYDEKGMYRHPFKVPASWKGKEINIVFDGSMTDTEVKINGREAGIVHRGAFYRFKYNISSLLFFDKPNLLEVTVSKMSADASVNNAERLADYWIFGGIFRPVFLECMPKEYIDHVGIDARSDGRFAMQVWTNNLKQAASVLTTITGAGRKVMSTTKNNISGTDSFTLVNTNVAHVAAWTSETPNLYNAHVVLQDAAGKTLYELNETFGFRTIEIKRGQGVYINGTQVKFKGVNRHCFWPETGRTLSNDEQLMDAQLLKEMNMNAVRCSHYPPDKYFLQLCDSLGIYVLDELAGWQKFYSTKAGEPLVKEMVLRDMNHPSIIFWDNGNEGGTNKELDDDFVKWDFQQRPVIHPHHRPGNQFNGIDCNHYEDYYSTEKILNDSLIYMPTEFLHSQDDGGGGAGMEDFWELHWKSQRSAGGFIWAMIDEAVARTDLNNVLDANGLNANDGILGPHREKEGSYYALRKIFSPIKVTGSPVSSGLAVIENRFFFLNTNQCSFDRELADFSNASDQSGGYLAKQKEKIASPDIPPGKKGNLDLHLPADYKNYDALVLTARDNFQKEIYKWILPLKSNQQLIGKLVVLKNDSTSLKTTDSTYVISGGEVSLVLDKRSGNLVTTRNTANDYVLSFKNGPVLVKGDATLTGSKAYQDNGDQVVEFTYNGNMKYTRWKINASGWTSLEYEYSLEGEQPFAGISFSYPENYILSSRWLGKGPCRQWKNRLAGTEINVWQNIYNNTQTGYSPVIYPEFKGYYGDIAWMELNTVEGKLYIASPDDGLFIRLFDFYGLTGSNRSYPELPVGNISFLDCIPPIGSKLATGLTLNTRVYGPQSELNHLSGNKKRTIWFYFGLPKK